MSTSAANIQQGKPIGNTRRHAWGSGVRQDDRGYRYLRLPDHPSATSNGYVYEHIVVWEKHHGSIPPKHCIHHLNGDTSDNRLENLGLVHSGVHLAYHTMKAASMKVREERQEHARVRQQKRAGERTKRRIENLALSSVAGKRLRTLRRSCKIRQGEVVAEANALGVNDSSLSRYERGFYAFSPEQIAAVNEAVNRILQGKADRLKEQMA